MIKSSIVSNRFLSKVIVILIAAFTFSACVTVTDKIYNVENQPFNTEEIIPMDVLEKRIRLIGAQRGWAFEVVSPGHMIGSVGTSKHKAKMDLTFDQKAFSIKYRDSEKLKATETTIHRRYNHWIALLEKDLMIQVELMSLN